MKCYVASPLITMTALRLLQLSDRTSAVMKSFSLDGLLRSDPMLAIVKTFGEINHIVIR